MKKVVLLLLLWGPMVLWSQDQAKAQINTTLDAWHQAAAEANFKNYFDALTDDAVFIGTDATEHWDKKAFEVFAKPYFDKGKAWSFTALERHIYFSNDRKTAWFDELLNTQMKICRGSGVLVLVNGQWKIKHYVLSMTVPNDNTDVVIKIKAPIEEALITTLKKNN
ncbi:nuclear transport factor 2 family protein [Flavobacterium sp. XGLA_31]|uniref:nuclear transport factor 2 family protein n=1 Tax=Flavobacterium sp. XGLA_31 TaxID=3447666 RepID=UPI003F3F8B64